MDAIWRQRVAFGIEFEVAITYAVPEPPLESCTLETIEAWNALVAALFANVANIEKVLNQEVFLTRVGDYLSQPLPSSHTGYEFLPTDGPICRSTFIELETIYVDSKDQIVAETAEFDGFFADILALSVDQTVSLIDNPDFIDFFTEGGDEAVLAEGLPDYFGFAFLSSEGAIPIEDVQ